MQRIVSVSLAMFFIVMSVSINAANDVPYGVGDWDAEAFGNHRVVIEVTAGAGEVVAVEIPWRRRDREPEKKNLILVDAATGERIQDIFPVELSRERGRFIFRPVTTPGAYYLYYLKWVSEGSKNYPKVHYPGPDFTADKQWIKKYKLDSADAANKRWIRFTRASVREIQSIDSFNSFYPMEVIATAEETKILKDSHAGERYLLFPEDRRYPIRMNRDLPYRWIENGAADRFKGVALRGEFYSFQLGLWACDGEMSNLDVRFEDLKMENGAAIPSSELRCINTGGVDWTGKSFKKTIRVGQGNIQPLWCGVQVPEDAVPGIYSGRIYVAPEGLPARAVTLELDVKPQIIEAAGDNEPWRHSRLRWLDSEIALDNSVVAPFTPLVVQAGARSISCLGRKVMLGKNGLPQKIQSFFAEEMTHLTKEARDVLATPITFEIEGNDGRLAVGGGAQFRFVKQDSGLAAWESVGAVGEVSLRIRGEMEFDGTIEYHIDVSAARPLKVGDIRLKIPVKGNVARYMLGLGRKGGFCPETFDWKWDVKKNHDSVWIGDVNAGLQCSLKDENYSRPLNTNFYHLKPLKMPPSWYNDGQGGIRLDGAGDGTFVMTAFSGSRTIDADETLHFDFRLMITPFKTIDTDAQWNTRYFHRFEPLDKIVETGANTVNVHHATDINPFINYPFIRPGEMKAYIDEAHDRNLKVKIYYTVRELSNVAPELFALRSLGDEILSGGPGGGFSWLQEHVGEDYIAGWLVPDLKDAALINSGVSRWHNYYLEGLAWLVKNVGIDGLYIDDVAFDRTVMKRVRTILDSGGPGALIDLHSANQFNERDGFANSANLYMEHFPFINRLWFGEYFDYGSQPDFWMTEVAGIPFGLMGEMLQDGGNPWRGMVYGMTARLPWAGDPRPVWKIRDQFGMDRTRMIGYWVKNNPVKTGNENVLASVYTKEGAALAAIASWAGETAAVTLDIDWKRLGIKKRKAEIFAPGSEGFQPERSFAPGEQIPVEPGKGWLLIIREKKQ